MTRVVEADPAILARIVAREPPTTYGGLSREALIKYDAAQARTVWGRRHRRRFLLVEGDEVLASADRYDLSGMLDQQPVTICGIAAVRTIGHDDASNHTGVLVDRLLQDATRAGADLALLFQPTQPGSPVLQGFEAVPTMAAELTVTESARYGAPMTLVRVGEDRDLEAIATMGQVRAGRYRFHLDRDATFIKHATTRKRLLAGLGSAGARQFEFVIAEEGITAAAYVVISVVGRTWMLEECGDRDPSGARVGALLQALIAREPVESRPLIQGWLPPGFLPPQVAVASETPAAPVLFARALSSRVETLLLSVPDVLYWHNDVF
ncbi:MAG: hypothetical protein AB7N65_11340 [Vicinamibacterales bacterium]